MGPSLRVNYGVCSGLNSNVGTHPGTVLPDSAIIKRFEAGRHSKAEVLAWKPRQPFHREALVVVKQGRRTFEAVVDVATARVVAWREIPGVEPNVIQEEQDGIEEQLKLVGAAQGPAKLVRS